MKVRELAGINQLINKQGASEQTQSRNFVSSPRMSGLVKADGSLIMSNVMGNSITIGSSYKFRDKCLRYFNIVVEISIFYTGIEERLWILEKDCGVRI